jgi:nucleoside-diphosphate-sugar epimerase
VKILVTGAEPPLPDILARLRAAQHDVRHVAELPRSAAELPALVEGCQAVVHGGAYRPGLGDQEALDLAGRRTNDLYLAAQAAGVERVVYLSTLELLRHYPERYRLGEQWQTHPPADLRPLCLYLGELVTYEFAHAHAFDATSLRLGTVIREEDATATEPDPSWVDPRDVAQAVEAALTSKRRRWGNYRVLHIAADFPNPRFSIELARRFLDYEPQHRFGWPADQPLPVRADRAPTPWPQPTFQPKERMKVLLLGAAGPVAAWAIRSLEPYHTLRLTDIKPMDTPHESRVVDITDPAQVEAAAEGMDVIVNLTVIRDDPVLAFDVNTRGAYNMMRAALRHGIGRVVQTGPTLSFAHRHDFGITEEFPLHSGNQLYAISKYLGQEICRAYAWQYGIEVPCLLYCTFHEPEEAIGFDWSGFIVSWRDSGESIRRAVEVERLPSPFEVFNIMADLPYRRFLNDKAKRILGWQPQENFRVCWERT